MTKCIRTCLGLLGTDTPASLIGRCIRKCTRSTLTTLTQEFGFHVTSNWKIKYGLIITFSCVVDPPYHVSLFPSRNVSGKLQCRFPEFNRLRNLRLYAVLNRSYKLRTIERQLILTFIGWATLSGLSGVVMWTRQISKNKTQTYNQGQSPRFNGNGFTSREYQENACICNRQIWINIWSRQIRLDVKRTQCVRDKEI